MNISLNGYGTGYVTLEAAEGLTEGVLAKISANHTAAAAGDGEAFIGPVLSVRDGLALVQLSGICTVAYTGGAPTLGYDMLACLASPSSTMVFPQPSAGNGHDQAADHR